MESITQINEQFNVRERRYSLSVSKLVIFNQFWLGDIATQRNSRARMTIC